MKGQISFFDEVAAEPTQPTEQEEQTEENKPIGIGDQVRLLEIAKPYKVIADNKTCNIQGHKCYEGTIVEETEEHYKIREKWKDTIYTIQKNEVYKITRLKRNPNPWW